MKVMLVNLEYYDCENRNNNSLLCSGCVDCSNFWSCFRKALPIEEELIESALDEVPDYIIAHLDSIASPESITKRAMNESLAEEGEL